MDCELIGLDEACVGVAYLSAGDGGAGLLFDGAAGVVQAGRFDGQSIGGLHATAGVVECADIDIEWAADVNRAIAVVECAVDADVAIVEHHWIGDDVVGHWCGTGLPCADDGGAAVAAGGRCAGRVGRCDVGYADAAVLVIKAGRLNGECLCAAL